MAAIVRCSGSRSLSPALISPARPPDGTGQADVRRTTVAQTARTEGARVKTMVHRAEQAIQRAVPGATLAVLNDRSSAGKTAVARASQNAAPRSLLDVSIACIARLATLAVLGACATQPALPDPLQAGWKGMPVCERLHEDAHHRILRCSFPPSVGHERHFHDRHFGYAIAGGRMRITDASGTREVDLATGSSFSSGGVGWHEVLNIGDSTVVYLIVEPR